MKTLLKIVWNLLAVFGLISIVAIVLGFWWINNNLPGVVSFSDNGLDINPENIEVPPEITPEMEDCFIEKLGADRVNAIKAGDPVTTTDYLKASGCL